MTQPNAIRRNRQMIYVGAPLRKALKGRKDTLTERVNSVAERYTALLARAGQMPMLAGWNAELYCNTLREIGHPLSAQEIAAFPALVEDWLKRHKEFPQAPGGTALMIIQHSNYLDLVALVDLLEGEL